MKTRYQTLLAPLFLLAVASIVIGQESKPEGKQSVKPGINKSYLDPDLKVDDWLKRFEVESREVFHAKESILEACQIQEGMVVADIGSGTGLYTRQFAQATGPKGWVYAVDIAAPFLKHIVARAKQEGHQNISAILSPEDAVPLPPESIDLAFICDTYHHFEYPTGTLSSLFRAIKKGGTVVVIDFERIEGVTRDWIMGHVRAGKPIFRQEIEDAGFDFVEEVKVNGLKENYFLRFRKN